MFKRFIKDTKSYLPYAWETAKANMKSNVANSYLYWLWWFLDPLLFMIIYSFVSLIVFDKQLEYLTSFIFIGLSCWNFFQRCVKSSVNLLQKNKGIISKIYLPKFVLIYVVMLEESIKMMISFLLVIITLILYRIVPTVRIIYALPILFSLYMFTFGISMLLMNFGVFVQDLENIINALLRLVFYLSGVFYSIEKITQPYRTILLTFNPMALIMHEMRECILYGNEIMFVNVLICIVIGVVLAIIGVFVIYKNENTYIKVM